MTTYFDLVRVDANNRICHIKSRLGLSMSEENASRLLRILGEDGACPFLAPAQMEALLDRAERERNLRAAGSDDPRARYEVPRLAQLHCLFHAARKRGYGVMVWQDPLAPRDAHHRR